MLFRQCLIPRQYSERQKQVLSECSESGMNQALSDSETRESSETETRESSEKGAQRQVRALNQASPQSESESERERERERQKQGADRGTDE